MFDQARNNKAKLEVVSMLQQKLASLAAGETPIRSVDEVREKLRKLRQEFARVKHEQSKDGEKTIMRFPPYWNLLDMCMSASPPPAAAFIVKSQLGNYSIPGMLQSCHDENRVGEKRKRSPNWTKDETEQLLRLRFQDRDVVKAFISSKSSTSAKRDAFSLLSRKLSESVNGSLRPTIEIREKLRKLRLQFMAICNSSDEGNPSSQDNIKYPIYWETLRDIFSSHLDESSEDSNLDRPLPNRLSGYFAEGACSSRRWAALLSLAELERSKRLVTSSAIHS
jgi:hypothetical protein